MTIRAKFAGTCKVCLKSIRVGEEIEWEKGSGAMHVACKGKTPEPLNSAPPVELISADTDLSALAQQHGHTLAGEPRLRYYTEQVHKGDKLRAIGETFEAHEGKMLTVARTKAVYYSQDYLDDMDMFDLHPGLYYQVTALAIERTVDEQAARDKAAADRAAAKAAKEAQENDARTKMSELRKCPDGFVETTSLIRALLPAQSEWTEIGSAERGSDYVNTKQAGEYFVCCYGGYDDYRQSVFVPQHLADQYFAAVVTESKITREEAVEWLSKYKGCVGTEIYEFAMRQTA